MCRATLFRGNGVARSCVCRFSRATDARAVAVPLPIRLPDTLL